MHLHLHKYNPTITPSGRKVTQAKRRREQTPLIVDPQFRSAQASRSNQKKAWSKRVSQLQNWTISQKWYKPIKTRHGPEQSPTVMVGDTNNNKMGDDKGHLTVVPVWGKCKIDYLQSCPWNSAIQSAWIQ
jgi:hypothetical protein